MNNTADTEMMDDGSIVACTVSRDVQNFDLLIDDMEAVLGDAWGDLGFDDVGPFLTQPEADNLEFVALAFDDQDSERTDQIVSLIGDLKKKKIKVILIAEDSSPMVLHKLLRAGADDFVPYPLPKGELSQAIERVRTPDPEPVAPVAPTSATSGSHFGGPARNGIILPVHGMSGGVGASTFAVNLAAELSAIDPTGKTKVCLLDLDFQYGSAATYLDLPRQDAIYELLSDMDATDSESFMQAVQDVTDNFYVFTAPKEMIPLDLVSPEDIEKLVNLAARHFDFVVIDMPTTLVMWTEAVMYLAHVYFAMVQVDLRNAQNTMRFIRALKAEEMPLEKVRYVLNMAPKFTDLSGKSRVKSMADSLSIDMEVQLSDGGRQLVDLCDNGIPLMEGAKKNPTRKDILKLAQSIYDLNKEVEAAI